MPVSEAARADLYNALSKTIGPDNTETLMGAVAWYTLDEVATKGDVATLRSEVSELRAGLSNEIAGLRAEMHSEIADLQKTITSWMLTLTVAMIGAIAGVAFLT